MNGNYASEWLKNTIWSAIDPIPHQLYPVASRAAAVLWAEKYAWVTRRPSESRAELQGRCTPLTVGRRRRRSRAFGQRSMPPAAHNPCSGAWSYPEAAHTRPRPYARSDGETRYIASSMKPMAVVWGVRRWQAHTLGSLTASRGAGRAGKARSTSLFEDEENGGCDVPIEGTTRAVRPPSRPSRDGGSRLRCSARCHPLCTGSYKAAMAPLHTTSATVHETRGSRTAATEGRKIPGCRATMEKGRRGCVRRGLRRALVLVRNAILRD
ncbi:hypothetical protein B0H17DRAFT_1133733 [Mycena rosella]|uniref:Uncharacterized protein n=1 Tax=Mycena rosella TaxID=1033263 RepID=A0AAD7DHE9_MYCRO|nr:hypothetical protein B0H17DRAFT_1133733 [Mycena rosella]